MQAQAVGNNLIAGCQEFQSLKVLIHNYSESAFNGNVGVRFYLSEDDHISLSDRLIRIQNQHLQISARGTAQVVISGPTIVPFIKGGNYHLGVWLDVQDALTGDNGTIGQDNASVRILPAKTLTILSDKVEFSAEEGCFDVQIESNAAWEISGNVPWVRSISPTNGQGNATVQVCYDPNTSPKDRGAPLLIKAECLPPKIVALKQHFAGLHVFPNPIGAQTKIVYALPDTGDVSIRLYAIDGRLIETLQENTAMAAGDYEWTQNLANLSPGIYILFVTTNKQKWAKRLTKH